MMNWLQRFMMGRYGLDQLSIGMLILAFLISLVSSFTGADWVSLISFAVLVLVILRMFSRNRDRRWKENQAFLKVFNPVKFWFIGRHRRFADRKTHRYFKCPGCKQELRVPRGKGKINIRCPKCGKEFQRKT